MNTPLDPKDADEFASWFRCLADGTRLRVLHTVASATGPLTVGEIVELVGKSQSTVSKHLQTLMSQNFVIAEPDGARTLIRINRNCMTMLPAAAAAVMAVDSDGGEA